jgi:hypothetical protein
MSRMMENVATVNSLVRTFLAVVLVGAAGLGGWKAYQTYYAADLERQSQIEALTAAREELAARDETIRQKEELLTAKTAEIVELNVTIEEQDQKIDQLDTSLRLLKVDHRIANLTIDDQMTDPTTGKIATTVSFVEVNDEGYPMGEPRQFQLEGDVVYIDHWVVKFEDKYVEEADLDRSTSIVLFRRIFGEYQEPSQGFTIDEVGSRPLAYGRGGQMSDFERQIWSDFWNIANNPDRAKELGIRAAHGEAVSIKTEKGRRYQVQLRASGGLSITPLTESAMPPSA